MAKTTITYLSLMKAKTTDTSDTVFGGIRGNKGNCRNSSLISECACKPHKH